MNQQGEGRRTRTLYAGRKECATRRFQFKGAATRPPSFRAQRGISLPPCFRSGQAVESLLVAIDRSYYVYILASESGVLYTGMTNNLVRRVWQHKKGEVPGFTQRYNVKKLVWFESHANPTSAIEREKQIKDWRRAKRVALIEAKNPQWQDLSGSAR